MADEGSNSPAAPDPDAPTEVWITTVLEDDKSDTLADASPELTDVKLENKADVQGDGMIEVTKTDVKEDKTDVQEDRELESGGSDTDVKLDHNAEAEVATRGDSPTPELVVTPPSLDLPTDITKESIRKKIWDYIESNNLANFPRPVHNRIPNFKDASRAGESAATLDVFKKAQTVKINPDKPQEQCRFLTLEANKTLLVPTPRLRQGLFNKINVPEEGGKEILRVCSTSQGVKEHSSPISLDNKVKVDLVIVGSVAVSKKGYRIGKGEGFADLEFAMMRAMEAVDENIIVVTTVHDCQVVDIPDELAMPHDLTVDYIVTPTEILECERRPKPEGIIWSMLTREKLSRVPILRRLRERQQEAGIDVTLKDGLDPEANDLEAEDHDRDDRRRDRRRGRRNAKERRDSERTGEGGEHSESGEGKDKEGGRRERRYNTRRRRRKSGRKSESERADGEMENGGESGGEGNNKENLVGDRRPRVPRHRRRRSTNKSRDGDRSGASGDEEKGDRDERDRGDRGYRNRDGGNRDGGNRDGADRPPRWRTNSSGPLATIYVGSLPRSLRVSEFKSHVRDKGVNPLRVIWYGPSGHAFLQFLKMDEAVGALDILHNFEIEGRPLKIEMSRRTSKMAAQGESEGRGQDEGEQEVKGEGSD